METGSTVLSTNNKRALLGLSSAMLALGNCGGPMLTRLYFLRGGRRIWLSSWLETGGWPIILLPLCVSYMKRRRGHHAGERLIFSVKMPLFLASAGVGILTGLDDYLYAYGVAHLPISTSVMILATHLAFTAGFAFVLVRHRFTPYSVNAIVLLTIGTVVLGLHASSDRPDHESNRQYYLGLLMTLAAAALYGFVLPAVELMYRKAEQVVTFSLVLETQMVISLFATGFCTVGMLLNDDFKAIPREAREYELGQATYYFVLVWTAIIWQFFYLGAVGVIFCASSLLSAILIAALLPVTAILAIAFYQEKFKAEKGLALALALWGFTSYFYGEIKHVKKKDQTRQMEMPQI